MTIAKAEEQLKDLEKHFRGYKIEIIKKVRGAALGPHIRMTAGDYSTKAFLGHETELLPLLLSCYRNIAIGVGQAKGVEIGKRVRSEEFRILLNFEDAVENQIINHNNPY